MSMETTRLIAIRHGETAWNVDTRIQGQLDIGLNEHGHWQARQAARALAEEPIAAIYSSDLSRAFDTARAIGAAVGLDPTPHIGLRERAFGIFEGRTWAEIETNWPDDTRRWRDREPGWAPAQGETLGVISFATAESGRVYGDQDLALAQDLGRRAAIAVAVIALLAVANLTASGAPRAQHAETWLALASGTLEWSAAVTAGVVQVSGERSDLGPYLPVA